MASTGGLSGIISGLVDLPTNLVATTKTPGAAEIVPGLSLTSGWYVFFGVGTAILLSGTKAAPIALAIISSALLYQVTLLIEGK